MHMARVRSSRLVSGAVGLLTAGVVLATPLGALAQSAPASPQGMVPGPDAAGSGWTLQLSAGDATTWMSIYGPADASDKSTITAAVKIYPDAASVAKDFDDNTNSMKKAGYTVADVQGIGDKAVQVSGSVGSKKTAESFYLFAVGTTMGAVAAETKPDKFADVDKVAVSVANAELNLVRSGGSASAAPAPATPGGLAKALALPFAALCDGWDSQNEQIDPAGKSYSLDFKATDGSGWAASEAIYVADSAAQVDDIMNKSVDNLRQQGWAIVPQDTYGDHAGLKGTMGSDSAVGTLYVMGVGNKVAMVLVVSPPSDAQAASDFADSMASGQEGRLY